MSGDFDHILLNVPSDLFDQELAFYTGAFKHYGYKVQMQFPPQVVGIGRDDGPPKFWLNGVQTEVSGGGGKNEVGVHVAFGASSREDVDKFHDAALINGGKDNGKPGVREMYHPHYYAAFVLSPAGHNIEVVSHTPASQ